MSQVARAARASGSRDASGACERGPSGCRATRTSEVRASGVRASDARFERRAARERNAAAPISARAAPERRLCSGAACSALIQMLREGGLWDGPLLAEDLWCETSTVPSALAEDSAVHERRLPMCSGAAQAPLGIPSGTVGRGVFSSALPERACAVGCAGGILTPCSVACGRAIERV